MIYKIGEKIKCRTGLERNSCYVKGQENEKAIERVLKNLQLSWWIVASTSRKSREI